MIAPFRLLLSLPSYIILPEHACSSTSVPIECRLYYLGLDILTLGLVGASV